MGKFKMYSISSHQTTQPRGKYYINKYVMPNYNKLIIKRLAVHYQGDTLVQRLSELKFCNLKTALDVLFDD